MSTSSPARQPSPHPDPWAEQERRRNEHRARRRRRRVWWSVPIAVVAVAAVALGAWLVAGDESPGAATSATPPRPPETALPATAAPTTPAPPSTVPPAAVVRLDEVWLLDRQDGTYDWGLVVASTDDADREGVTVTARLIADSGAVTEVLLDEIGLLPAGGRAAVGGVVRGLAESPVRLEADVVVGRPVIGLEDGSIEVLAVERRPDVRGGGGEVLTGRLVSTIAADVGPVRVAAIWRDETGAVVAAAFRDVERVRPRVDARFEMSLEALIVPDGPPAEVFVVR